MNRLHKPIRPAGRTLFWHVFLPNAVALALAVCLLAFTPASISSSFSIAQAVALFAALGVTVLVNVVLIRRAVAPLEQLTRVMADIDPLRPGQRVEVDRTVAETAKLAEVFNSMIDRLETERRESGRRMLELRDAQEAARALSASNGSGARRFNSVYSS